MANLIGRTIVLHLICTLFAFTAKSQGLFEEKFDGCNSGAPCIYCGDTSAHYGKDLGSYISWNVNHSFNNSRYVLRNFDVMYEVFVDTAGHTCVVSVKTIGVGWSWLLKDDVRKWINNMPSCKPVTKKSIPINSTVIIECRFRNNFLFTEYVKPPEEQTK